MPRRATSARATALRRAQQAKAARDAKRLRREQDLEAALADYFQATEQAGRIRAEAQRKADQLLAAADVAAQTPEQAAAAAIRQLRELAGSVAEVAALCGITASTVRAMLADSSTGPASAAEPSGPVPVPGPPGTQPCDEPGMAPTISDGDSRDDTDQPEMTAAEERESRG